MPPRADSWSSANSREVALSAASQPWRINFVSDEHRDESPRVRFYSTREQDQDWSTWYPVEKLDAKLEHFLRNAKTANEPGIDIVACGSNAQAGVIALTESQFYVIDGNGAPISRVAFFEEKGQFAHHVKWEGSRPTELLIWWHSPTSFIHEVSCCLRIDLGTRSAVIIYFDRNENRVAAILDYIDACLDDYLPIPFRFLLRLLSGHGDGSESWRLLIDAQIRMMEGETGARSQKLELEPDKGHLNNFGRLIMSTQNANTSLVSLEHVTNWHILVNDFLTEMWELYIDLQKALPSYRPLNQERHQGIIYDLRNQRNQCKLRLARVNGAQKRMQSQISILLSLISQRDNRLNLVLAHESREIAAAAKHDSKIMRVIAVLTLVFLPATLIATIFSANVINLGQLDPGEPRVSPLWWVFAVPSVALTMVVMIAGYLFLRYDSTAHSGSLWTPINPG